MKVWKIVLGILLIAAGVLFVLTNMGIISNDIKQLMDSYWPLIIIVWGLALFINGFAKKLSAKKKFNHIYFALSVLIVGLALQNTKLEYLPAANFGLDKLILALILIYAGVRLILYNKWKFDFVVTKIGSGSAEKYVGYGKNREDKFIGEIRIGDGPWFPKSKDYNLNIGEVRIDFTNATLDEGLTHISVSGWVGEMEVIIPEDMAVDIKARTNVGETSLPGFYEKSGLPDNTIAYQSENYEEALQKLKLDLFLNVGHIKIRKV